MNLSIPLSVLIVHYIADFRLQTEWMAIGKSKSNGILTIHALVYSLCFLFWGWRFSLVTFYLHWITDWFTSRYGRKNWYIDLIPRDPSQVFAYEFLAHYNPIKRARFWNMIGFDQLIHFTCLTLTYRWLL